MIAAIFEILFLLSISCLIGIYFTRRYWKAKFISSQESAEPQKAAPQKAAPQKAAPQKIEQPQVVQNDPLANEKVEQLEGEIEQLTKELEKKDKKAKESKAHADKAKELEQSLILKDEALAEKEREIETLSRELDKRKISYYKQIDGKRYKALTLKMAEESVEGKGDGRISKGDAEKIFDTISDGKSYTQVEKDTMRYLRDNFKWTEQADELFRKKVRSWAAKGHELD